jgi:hypothetical protein
VDGDAVDGDAVDGDAVDGDVHRGVMLLTVSSCCLLIWRPYQRFVTLGCFRCFCFFFRLDDADPGLWRQQQQQ